MITFTPGGHLPIPLVMHASNHDSIQFRILISSKSTNKRNSQRRHFIGSKPRQGVAGSLPTSRIPQP
jgi:hypothetical protein